MKPIALVILAAGKGTRMKSSTPKVLYPVNNKPMIRYLLETIEKMDYQRCVIVVGYRAEYVKLELGDFKSDFVLQEPQNGTGHAVLQAESILSDFMGDTIVLYGDVPFIKLETLKTLIQTHQNEQAAATILTVDMPDPTRYGRIIRDIDESVLRIVEHADATEDELNIKEINTGIICFRNSDLFTALHQIRPHNKQQELYLTDTITIFREQGYRISAVKTDDPFEVIGIDNQEKVAYVETRLNSGR